LDQFIGYHSEWNLGSPGGWDYQRITQEIAKAVWGRLFQNHSIDADLDFDHPLLHPVNGFVNMLELQNSRVCWQGTPVSVIFMDFNTDVLLNLHRKQNLTPLLQAVREGRVINPRGTEPINVKSMFEVITVPENKDRFHKETIERTPWTRQFHPRRTLGPDGETIPDLVEWTRANWDNLVLKPERGYSGKGVRVGGINKEVDDIISLALNAGDYIVQEKIDLNLWAEDMPWLGHECS